MMKYFCLIIAAVLTFSLSAQDVQWRGPDRNGIYPDTGLMKVWPKDGPELLLSIKGIGKGYSSAVATDKLIFVSGMKDTLDMCMAYDFSGNLIWERSFGTAWNNSFPDTRSTPTVDQERIYLLSGLDNLVCFNAENGDEIWSVDLHKTYGSNWDMFGVSESVHLIGDKVICTPAGDQTTVVALNKYTGELIWKSESMGGQRSNASSTLFKNDTILKNVYIDEYNAFMGKKVNHLTFIGKKGEN